MAALSLSHLRSRKRAEWSNGRAKRQGQSRKRRQASKPSKATAKNSEIGGLAEAVGWHQLFQKDNSTTAG